MLGCDGTPVTAVTRPPRSGPIIRYFMPDHNAGWYTGPARAAIAAAASRPTTAMLRIVIYSVGRRAFSLPFRNVRTSNTATSGSRPGASARPFASGCDSRAEKSRSPQSTPKCFSARNHCSPCSSGTRKSLSECRIRVGVLTFFAYLSGERSQYSRTFEDVAAEIALLAVCAVARAVVADEVRDAAQRYRRLETASVWPTIQFVMKPP